MKELIAKLGKCDNKRSNGYLGLRRLHYNSCSINRFFINISCSNILKRLLQRWYKFSSHLNSMEVQDRMRLASPAEIVFIGNRAFVASAATRAALPDPLW
jgi:hypothetical protein